jgi:hypothetical protein
MSQDPHIPQGEFRLERTAFGELVWIGPQGQRVADVVPVRASPIKAPQDGIALVDPEGHELDRFL